MRWRRAIVAVVVGLVAAVALFFWGSGVQGAVSGKLTDWITPRWVSVGTKRLTTYGLILTLYTAPAAIVAVLIYATGKPFTDTETRCRQCGYILKGLTQPRCPECGERI